MNKGLMLFGALALGLGSPLLAQTPAQVKYANTITAEDLTKYLTYLASDEMKGRDTGSEEGKLAALSLIHISEPTRPY